MRKLLRNIAKAEMVRRGYSKPNRVMKSPYHGWRSFVNAYPVSVDTGKQMKKDFRGKKKYPKGHRRHLFVY